jgi:small subunit ribosomal protein S4
MSKYRGPRLRLIRKLGQLPGLTNKSSNKVNTPGQHGQPQVKFLKKLSPYGLRLLEKQKLRFNYNINERQLIRYIKKAKKENGSTGEILLTLLEMRLDNIVYRLGMAPSILAARQLVSHGHILVNKEKVNIASYSCKIKDIISVQNKESSQKLVKKLSQKCEHSIPDHLSFNKENLIGIINSIINRNLIELRINELLVVEYYSRN